MGNEFSRDKYTINKEATKVIITKEMIKMGKLQYFNNGGTITVLAPEPTPFFDYVRYYRSPIRSLIL